MRSFAKGWVVGLGLALAATASGANKKAAGLVKEAEELYAKGQYADAIVKLKAANELEPHPRLLYNIARAYDQNNDYKEALEYYRQYVSSESDTDPTLVKKANLSMDRIRGALAKAQTERDAQDAERKRLEFEKQQAEEKAKAEAEAARKQREELEAKAKAEEEARARSTTGRKVISYVGIGAAAAGLGLGVVGTLGALDNRSKFKAATTLNEKSKFESDARSQALLADIGWSVAVAGAVTAFFAWPPSDEPAKSVDVKAALVPLPGGGAASVTVTF